MRFSYYILTLLVLLLPLTVQAQQRADTTYIFRFLPDNDLFYIPYNGNGVELDKLLNALETNIDLLREGKMFICVSSYAASGNEKMNAGRMGYLRGHRVKSELITRAGITEEMFVTDRQIPTLYGDTLRNVVVVAFPASVEKVEQIAGAKAAETVRTYYREIEEEKQEEARTRQEVIAREAEARQKTETEIRRAEQEARRIAGEQEAQRQAEAEKTRLANQHPTEVADNDSYRLSLRANLLSWATLTPDFGAEWRINHNWGILLNGSWTSWSWDNANRRYALWKISPEVRYYTGKEKRGYLGAMYHVGEFNYKLSETGKQGNYQGGGITGGYQLPLNGFLSLDFHAGFGYTRANYEKYTVIDGVRVRRGNEVKNYWGINKAGVTLVWKLF